MINYNDIIRVDCGRSGSCNRSCETPTSPVATSAAVVCITVSTTVRLQTPLQKIKPKGPSYTWNKGELFIYLYTRILI